MYITRWAENELRNAMQWIKIVMISGPRQCGKTTLMKHHLGQHDILLKLDETALQQDAADSPNTFLNRYRNYKTIAIDEIQKALPLIGEIKAFVDTDQRNGRFLISGSANYRSLPSTQESLAGRLAEVRLRTFAEGEIQNRSPRFLQRLIQNDFSEVVTRDECNKDIILQKALLGGYPSVQNLPANGRKLWFRAYLQNLLERDLIDVKRFSKPNTMIQILRYLASTSGKTINLSTVCSALNTSRYLIEEYLQALKILYLIDEIPAWTRFDTDRIGKASKWFISDSGLAAAALGYFSRDSLFKSDQSVDGDIVGKLVENWCYMQLASQLGILSDWTMYHFRTRNNQEIDFLLENSQGELIGLEIKAGESVDASAFRHLNWFRDNIAKERKFRSFVLYSGQLVRQFGPNNIAIPMAYLWL